MSVTTKNEVLLQADKLIKEEMLKMLQFDAVKYPLGPVGGRQAPKMDKISDVDLAKVCIMGC